MGLYLVPSSFRVERFVDMAKEVEASDSPEAFEDAFMLAKMFGHIVGIPMDQIDIASLDIAKSGKGIWMSASLIGRLGSSAFRLSTTAVPMSLAGSCFSPESAPRPFHHGIRRRGGTI